MKAIIICNGFFDLRDAFLVYVDQTRTPVVRINHRLSSDECLELTRNWKIDFKTDGVRAYVPPDQESFRKYVKKYNMNYNAIL